MQIRGRLSANGIELGHGVMEIRRDGCARGLLVGEESISASLARWWMPRLRAEMACSAVAMTRDQSGGFGHGSERTGAVAIIGGEA